MYIYILYIHIIHIHIYIYTHNRYWGELCSRPRPHSWVSHHVPQECPASGTSPWQVVENNATASAWTPAASRLGSTPFLGSDNRGCSNALGDLWRLSVKANFGTLLHKSIEYQCQRRWHMLRLLTGPFVPWLNHQTSHLRSISRRRSEALHHDLNGSQWDMEWYGHGIWVFHVLRITIASTGSSGLWLWPTDELAPLEPTTDPSVPRLLGFRITISLRDQWPSIQHRKSVKTSANQISRFNQENLGMSK